MSVKAGQAHHGVSDVTIGRHPREYCFAHKGVIIAVSQSIQLSKGERVNLAIDEEHRMFVIHSIGAHLPDSTSG